MAYFKARVGSSGGSETPTLLWTNDNPSAAVTGNWPDINIAGLSNYKAFMFEFRKIYNDSTVDYFWADSSDLQNKNILLSQFYNERYWAVRPMYIDYTNSKINSSIWPTLYDSVQATIQNGGAYTIPTRIWGYKNTIINI